MCTLREPTPWDAALLAWLEDAPPPLVGARRQVVEVDGQGVGVVAVAYEPTRVVLTDLRLLPTYHGRGLAAALLKGLLRAASGAGVPFALCVPDGPHTERLRERLAAWGFIVAGETPEGWLLTHDLRLASGTVHAPHQAA